MSDPSSISDAHSATLAILHSLANAAEVSFDPARAAQALRAAVRDIPPTQARAARLRMQQAASSIGVQLLTRHLSIRDALQFVSREEPLALYTLTADGWARWFVMERATSSKGQLAGSENWLSIDQLSELFGASDGNSVLEWFVPVKATPMLEASSPYDDVIGLKQNHDDSHGHEASHGRAHGHASGHGERHVHLPPFRRLLGLLRPELRDLRIVFIFAIGVGVFTLATPVAAMSVVNSVALATVRQQIIVLCIALFFALALASFMQFIQTFVVEFIQRRLFVRVAQDLAYRLPRVNLSAFDRQHGPELVNRFFDVLTVQKAGATLLLDGLTIALQILIGLLLLGYYHTLLLGFDLVLIASLFLLFTVLGWGATRSAIRESIAKYRVAGWMEELAQHPIAFKMSGGPEFALERTDVLTREYILARMAHFRVLMRQFGFALFLQASANVALLAVGGHLVIENVLTLGELVAAEIVLTLVLATFTKLYKQLEAYYDMLAAVDKLGHLIDLPLEREGGSAPEFTTDGATVVVHNLSFTYEDMHHPAISDFSMTLNPGERVAIMGPNGSGKSTLSDILFGLRMPSEGWVQIDGIDLRDMRLESLRENIAFVDRLEIFEGSIIANIRMGREDLSIHDVRAALEQVGLLRTVLDLPNGLNTMLWPGGAPLSLGQANRLILARAIVGRPRLLILDETLDHMDSEVRGMVLPAILGRKIHWTLIVVTHSEEVAKLCDRVVRLKRADHSLAAHAHHHEHGNGHTASPSTVPPHHDH